MKKRLLALLFATTMIIGCFTGCAENENAKEVDSVLSSTAEVEEPSNVNIMYSKGFKIELLGDGIKRVTDGENRELILVPKSLGKIPDKYKESTVITTPVDNAVFLSSTQVCTFRITGDESILNSIGGVKGDETTWEGIPEIQQRVKSGEILNVGGDGTGEPDYELIQSLNPDVVFVYTGTSPQTDEIAKLEELGINYAVDNEYMEENYLARMEWMRFILTFYNADEDVDSVMNKAKTTVDEVKAEISGLDKPKVAIFSVYDGTVYATMDNSWVGTMLADMGGVNVFSGLDTKTITAEEAFNRVQDADVIIYTSTPAYCAGMSGVAEAFPQLTECKAYQNDRVYQYSDIFWKGIDQSDIMAADMAATFYPEKFADRTNNYFVKLAK